MEALEYEDFYLKGDVDCSRPSGIASWITF
jgi:hypothetical protein